MSDMGVWAWSRPGVNNFGDELGPAILARLGVKHRRVADIAYADMITIGSILERTGPAKQGLMVWGSGLIRGGPVDASKLDVRAVRGRITSEALGVNVPHGDPALLVSALWERPPVKWRVGVIPHYMDTEKYPWADVVIDVRESVDKVLHDIGSCAQIVSSSLHGVVAAQSWGIPTMRLHCHKVIGGNLKWADYATGFDTALEDVQQRLFKALP